MSRTKHSYSPPPPNNSSKTYTHTQPPNNSRGTEERSGAGSLDLRSVWDESKFLKNSDSFP